MAGPVVTRDSMDALAQDEYARPTHRRKKPMLKKKRGKRKPAKIKRSPKAPSKPSLIQKAFARATY